MHQREQNAVTLYDPDAPTGSGWWHWLIINIPSTATGLKENAGNITDGKAPKGAVQTKTDFGARGFGGACPPAGDKAHRYIFTLFALNVEKLNLAVESSGALVGYNLNGHAIKKATLKAYYSR